MHLHRGGDLVRLPYRVRRARRRQRDLGVDVGLLGGTAAVGITGVDGERLIQCHSAVAVDLGRAAHPDHAGVVRDDVGAEPAVAVGVAVRRRTAGNEVGARRRAPDRQRDVGVVFPYRLPGGAVIGDVDGGFDGVGLADFVGRVLLRGRLKLDLAVDADVVRQVGVAVGRSVEQHRGRTGVRVLPGDGGAGFGQRGRIAGRQADDGADGAEIAVGDVDVGQIDVAGIGDRVGPRHRSADGDVRTRRGVGVLAVGRFLDVDSRGRTGGSGRRLRADLLTRLDGRLHGPFGPVAVQGQGERYRGSDLDTAVELHAGHTSGRVVAVHHGARPGAGVVDVALFHAARKAEDPVARRRARIRGDRVREGRGGTVVAASIEVDDVVGAVRFDHGRRFVVAVVVIVGIGLTGGGAGLVVEVGRLTRIHGGGDLEGDRFVDVEVPDGVRTGPGARPRAARNDLVGGTGEAGREIVRQGHTGRIGGAVVGDDDGVGQLVAGDDRVGIVCLLDDDVRDRAVEVPVQLDRVGLSFLGVERVARSELDRQRARLVADVDVDACRVRNLDAIGAAVAPAVLVDVVLAVRIAVSVIQIDALIHAWAVNSRRAVVIAARCVVRLVVFEVDLDRDGADLGVGEVKQDPQRDALQRRSGDRPVLVGKRPQQEVVAGDDLVERRVDHERVAARAAGLRGSPRDLRRVRRGSRADTAHRRWVDPLRVHRVAGHVEAADLHAGSEHRHRCQEQREDDSRGCSSLG